MSGMFFQLLFVLVSISIVTLTDGKSVNSVMQQAVLYLASNLPGTTFHVARILQGLPLPHPPLCELLW